MVDNLALQTSLPSFSFLLTKQTLPHLSGLHQKAPCLCVWYLPRGTEPRDCLVLCILLLWHLPHVSAIASLTESIQHQIWGNEGALILLSNKSSIADYMLHNYVLRQWSITFEEVDRKPFLSGAVWSIRARASSAWGLSSSLSLSTATSFTDLGEIVQSLWFSLWKWR